MTMQDDELQMIRDAAARLVRDATAAGIRAQRDMDAGTWAGLVESGALALPVPEVAGGLGAGPAELCAIAEELGRGLQVGSFLLTQTLAGQLLAGAPPGERRDRLLESLLGGTRNIAVADIEPRGRGAGAEVQLAVRRKDGEWTLEGAKTSVWVAPDTDRLLVTACAAESGAALLVELPLDSAGIARREFATIDGGRALGLHLQSVRVPGSNVLAGPAAGFAAVRARAWDLVLLGEAAECVGLMHALLQRTAEYLAARKQFGQPLSKLQVLRHRLADMALARFPAEGLVALAVQRFEVLTAQSRTRLAAAAIAKALQGARFVAEQSVQLHGGMGVSEEMPIGRYLRRVLALEATLGSADFHRSRYDVGVAA